MIHVRSCAPAYFIQLRCGPPGSFYVRCPLRDTFEAMRSAKPPIVRTDATTDRDPDKTYNPPSPATLLARERVIERPAVLAPREIEILHHLRERPSDDGMREVYADWLEENNQMAKARFVREELSLIRERERTPQEIAVECRYAAFAGDSHWRSLVSRAPILHCAPSMAARCPARWHRLRPTTGVRGRSPDRTEDARGEAGELTRDCDACHERVTYCTSDANEDATTRIVVDAAVNPATLRRTR